MHTLQKGVSARLEGRGKPHESGQIVKLYTHTLQKGASARLKEGVREGG